MERDDVIEYSLYNHHGEEEGQRIRKKILKTTIILTIITVAEIICGINFSKGSMELSSPGAWTAIKIGYICLTLVKAGYIVLVFMHLGDERKIFKWTLLTPYIVFIVYTVLICLKEAVTIPWVSY